MRRAGRAVLSTEYRVPSTEYRVPSTEYREEQNLKPQRTQRKSAEPAERNMRAGDVARGSCA
jgi:hypothetical protein